MLLNFTCDNFKSFRDGFQFNMIPEKRMTDLEYSILSENIGGQTETGLSVSVIYGPNAAGKTSIVNAMSCMQQLVLRGNIKDAAEDRVGDHVSKGMSLAPFAFLDTPAPVRFDVTFTDNGLKYRYVVSAFLGAFLDKTADRYISEESLYVNDTAVYCRTKDSVEKLNLSPIKEYLNEGLAISSVTKIKKAMSSNIVPDTLLLQTDFNSFCSKKLVRMILEWFETGFIVINSSDRVRSFPATLEDNGPALIDESINLFAREAGIIGSDFAYVKDPETQCNTLVSVLKKTDDSLTGLDAELIESMGTLRLVSIIPIILTALKSGAVLVMDEMDASLHPMIVMNLISIFHNDSVNKNKAQLIFNTHNPIYLNHKLLRRDEIKFVERNSETKSSTLYALSDFKANGETSVRKTSDYMKNYFINRYGAIVDIDFTDIIQKILEGASNDA